MNKENKENVVLHTYYAIKMDKFVGKQRYFDNIKLSEINQAHKVQYQYLFYEKLKIQIN